MRKFSCFVALLVLAITAPAWASGLASRDDAQAMAIKAAEYLQSVGPEKALPEFSAKDSRWHDRDLYVTVQNSQGVMVAHGTNPGLIGRNVLDLKDVDGKPFNREIQAMKESGWIAFKWQNPISKAVENKVQYTIRVGDYIVSVGAYAQ